MIAFFNHFRLTWRLVWDRRVSLWSKLLLIGLPLAYAMIPLPDDMLPLVGYLDDVLVFVLFSLAFNHLPARSLLQEHRQVLNGTALSGDFRALDNFRHPQEQRDLALGFCLSFLMLALSGWAAGAMGLVLLAASYGSASLMRSQMVGNSIQITPQQLPELYQLLLAAQRQLPPVKVELFVTQDPVMNAYTFGYREPYTIVLSSDLVENMTPAEIQAVIGHELGHILLGHTHLIGLMAGVTGFLRLLFYRWSRSCEYSADAAALLACDGDLEPVVTTMLKLGSGLSHITFDVQAFLEQGRAIDQATTSSAEFLSTHPFIQNRIRRLIQLSDPQSQPTNQMLISNLVLQA
jgi:Zn-dependent protease with chaperone function